MTVSWSCLRRLARVLALDQGLLDDPRRLVRRDGLAAFERARPGAPGHHQRERETHAQEAGEVHLGGAGTARLDGGL